MSPDDLAVHGAVLDRWFAAYNRHDVDALCSLTDPDVEVVPLEGAMTAPPGTTYHGHKGLRALLTAGFERFPQLRVEHGKLQPKGGQVTVDLEFRLDDGVAPPVVRKGSCRYRIADGRILRMRAVDHQTPLEAAKTRTRAEALSPREREVLSMLARGRTVVEIATELYLSPFTVRTHVRNAKDKLQARTTAHAVAIALGGNALDV